MEFLRNQIALDITSGTRTRANQMLTYKFVELCWTPLTTALRRRFLTLYGRLWSVRVSKVCLFVLFVCISNSNIVYVATFYPAFLRGYLFQENNIQPAYSVFYKTSQFVWLQISLIFINSSVQSMHFVKFVILRFHALPQKCYNSCVH